ncbi:uncharacterized protein LOC121880493 isoform X2 [Homarus americanus]|uniref:uncharacterized protein LOC121880493 isoform X2 n=1 Tax=Homarus americanus TaxID=6706 RepID=UPI001C46D5EE|nr:uncharacterized protein LOC121880493 isoform X2 [Homarus americanus]
MASRETRTSIRSKKDICDYPNLKAVLPPSYDYYVESYEECADHESEKRFNARFRIAQSEATRDTMRQWLEEFCSHSLTTYRIERTYPSETKWFIYRVDLRCHHNTKPSSHKRVRTPHKKHTACPAKMTIKIRQKRLSKRKSHEVHLKTHPVEVALHHLHNHLIQKKDALRFRDPDSALVEKFRKMYRAGYKPAAALEIHKRDLRMEYEDDYHMALEDRGLCPDMNWCYRQYYLMDKKPLTDDAANKILSLEEFLAEYNKKCKEKCAAMKLVSDDSNNLVVALVTPLMKRCHTELTQSGKLVFVDTVKVDYLRCKVYLLLTHSVAGGLPLGVLVTSTDCSSIVLQGLHLFMNLLSDEGFGGRGVAGPAVIMMQDDDVQFDAMALAFPGARLLLCPYHVVQTAWECLCSGQDGVDCGSRQELFEMVKQMVFAKSLSDLEEKYRNLMTSPPAQYSLKFFNHMEELYSRRYEWAVCLREDLPNKTGTIDIVNVTMESLKDKVLCQTKACTMVQLLEFLTEDMEEYYEKKITYTAHDKCEAAFIQQHLQDKKMTDTLEIVPFFRVKNSTTGECYDVDMSLGLCSCPVGVIGELCRHQYALTQKLNINSLIRKPLSDTASKIELNKIFSGLQCPNFSSKYEEKLEVCNKPSSVGDAEMEMKDESLSERKQEAEDDQPCEVNNEVTEEHITLETFLCLICSKVFSSQARLARHRLTHNHNKPVVCDLCGLGFNTKLAHQHHLQHKHKKEKPYECEVCGKSFVGSQTLLDHALIHEQTRSFACDICGKLFRSPKCVARHKKCHKMAKNLTCSQCNESFLVKSDFEAHSHKVEDNIKKTTIVEVRDPLHYPHHQQEQEVIIINAEGPLVATTLPSISASTDNSSNYPYQITLATPAAGEDPLVPVVNSVFVPQPSQEQQEETGVTAADQQAVSTQQHFQTSWHAWT